MEYKINNCKYDIKEYIKYILKDDYNIVEWDEWLDNQDYESLQQYPNILVNAEEDGKLIGICSVKYISDRECYLNSFYVNHDYRNQGIGTKLFDMCMEYIKEKGFLKIKLSADRRFKPAIRLYEKHGFILDEVKEDVKELWFIKYI